MGTAMRTKNTWHVPTIGIGGIEFVLCPIRGVAHTTVQVNEWDSTLKSCGGCGLVLHIASSDTEPEYAPSETERIYD